MKILDLKRNDLEGALALYRDGCTPDVAHSLLLLQDDPEELMAAMILIDKIRKIA